MLDCLFNLKPLGVIFLKSILSLTPVRFKWKNNNKSSVGLIAEEVDSVGLKDFVIYNDKGQPDGVSYKLLTKLLCSNF